MSTLGGILLLAAAVCAVYFLCLRPMSRGRGHCGASDRGDSEADLDRQIADLREELRILRAEDALDAGQAPPPGES